jgi:hypothetical protein
MLAGSGAKGGKELFAGKHEGWQHEEKEKSRIRREEFL